MSLTTYVNSISSTYLKRLVPCFLITGSTYRRKKIGENGKPYGRPPYSSVGSNSSPLYEILISLSITKELT